MTDASVVVKSDLENKVRHEPYFVINSADALGSVRVGRVFQKSIGMMDMIIDFTSHETRTSLMCL